MQNTHAWPPDTDIKTHTQSVFFQRVFQWVLCCKDNCSSSFIYLFSIFTPAQALFLSVIHLMCAGLLFCCRSLSSTCLKSCTDKVCFSILVVISWPTWVCVLLLRMMTVTDLRLRLLRHFLKQWFLDFSQRWTKAATHFIHGNCWFWWLKWAD